MEENKNNQQQQNQFQMGISPEVAEGTYQAFAPGIAEQCL